MEEQTGNGDRETYTARLSFRSTAKNAEKLLAIARARKWVNAQGKPNVSAVLNFLIEGFDLSLLAGARKKEKANER